MTIPLAQLKKIVRDNLHLRKIAARWIPHLLTDQRKRQRVECSKGVLKMFEPDGPKWLCDVVRGDETRLYFYGIPNKRSNQMWVAADGKRPVALQRSKMVKHTGNPTTVQNNQAHRTSHNNIK